MITRKRAEQKDAARLLIPHTGTLQLYVYNTYCNQGAQYVFDHKDDAETRAPSSWTLRIEGQLAADAPAGASLMSSLSRIQQPMVALHAQSQQPQQQQPQQPQQQQQQALPQDKQAGSMDTGAPSAAGGAGLLRQPLSLSFSGVPPSGAAVPTPSSAAAVASSATSMAAAAASGGRKFTEYFRHVRDLQWSEWQVPDAPHAGVYRVPQEGRRDAWRGCGPRPPR